MNDPIDVEQVLAAIASANPTPLATERALAVARASLAARRRRRWIVPLSCAATLLLLAGFFMLTSQPHVSAAERLAQALDASRAYNGWVHMTTDRIATDFNTQTGARAWCGKYYIGKDRVSAGYQNPATREYATYDSASGFVILSTLGPAWIETLHDRASDQPLTYPELIDFLKKNLDVKLAKVTVTSEDGLERYDIASAVSAASPPQNKIWPPPNYPSAIWIDPKTGLIAKSFRDGQTTTFTYGAPDIRSIYDAGAPRTALLRDIRPTKQAAAIADRIHARTLAPFPDGVCVSYRESSSTEESAEAREINRFLTVHAQSGPRWIERLYHVRPDANSGKSLQLPPDWSTAGGAELFRRLAAVTPEDEWSGDDKKGELRDFADPTQNARFLGRTARSIGRHMNPSWHLYPLDAHYDTGDSLEIITAPGRPGQAGLRVQSLDDASPQLDRSDNVYWVDPLHSDRPVTYIETYYKKPGEPALAFKAVTEFSDYRDLPAPDSRSYPTRWTKIGYTPDNDGNLIATSNQTTTFCFFPGKTLAKLPEEKPVSSQP